LQEKSLLAPTFSDEQWLVLLAYQADIFRLKDLNAGFQNALLITLSNKIEAMIRKLSLWRTRLDYLFYN